MLFVQCSISSVISAVSGFNTNSWFAHTNRHVEYFLLVTVEKTDIRTLGGDIHIQISVPLNQMCYDSGYKYVDSFTN